MKDIRKKEESEVKGRRREENIGRIIVRRGGQGERREKGERRQGGGLREEVK